MTRPAPSRRVFVIAHDGAVSSELEDRLGEIGCAVCGREAQLDRARGAIEAARPDLVLCQAADGACASLLELVSDTQSSLDVPFLCFCTERPADAERHRSVAHLRRPFVADLLAAHIDRALERRERERENEAALRFLSTELLDRSGAAFYDEIAKRLPELVGMEIGFVGLLRRRPPPLVQTLGFVIDGVVQPPCEYEIAGTPCEGVIRGAAVAIPEGVGPRYPGDVLLAELGAEAYVGAPFFDSRGEVVGHVGLMSRRRIDDLERITSLVRLFALRVAAELERERGEARFSAVFEHAPDALLLVDDSGKFVRANQRAVETFGYTQAELEHLGIEALVPPSQREGHPGLRRTFHAHPRPRKMATNESLFFAARKDASLLPVEISLSPLASEGGRLVVAAVRDVSARLREQEERARLEAELRHAQKMESLGSLAGGIAHDFNNLLAAILGNLDLARTEAADNPTLERRLDEIDTACKRASDLVRQITAFGRKQPTTRTVTHIGPILEEAVKLLRATLPAKIRISARISVNCPTVFVDVSQIHQVLMNLGTNAWHAIEASSGAIELTAQPELVTASPPGTTLAAGRYLRIDVADDGVGMDEATKERIFEPFFTTKELGKGTGLGLAVVHGIVADHGGGISVESVAMRGTTFSIYLPEQAGVATEPQPIRSTPTAGSGRVLLVDDEGLVARATKQILRRLGYEVELHLRPTDALRAFREAPTQFDVVITDQSMPEMDGLELAQAVAEVRPGMPVILVSGNRTLADEDRDAAHVAATLDKPYTAAQLSHALALVLRRA